jgi:hypothetical protein
MKSIICSNKDKEEFCRRIMEIDCDKKRFIAEFKIYRRVRSLSQNKLYYLWLNCISDETGNQVEDMHEFFKDRFIPWSSREVFGVELKIHATTTNLDTKEFTDYLEKIRMFALDQGIYLPNPNDHGWDEFYAHYNK